MPKRALIALATFGLVATACISSSTPPVNFGSGTRFVPFVVDSLDDMGRGDAVAVTPDGVPYVSYFGFPAKLEGNAVPVPRPFGSPTVPGVMLSTSSSNGLWQRGAVDMMAPLPALNTAGKVTIPFGPEQTEDLALTADNSNGTSLVVDSGGTAHVAWTFGSAVEYATSTVSGAATVTDVFDLPGTGKHAGPIGRPSVALDADGNPWIAFTIETAKGLEVHAVHQDGNKWVDAIAASFPSCNGCPAPQPTGVGLVGGALVVVYADPAAEEVRAATLGDQGWTESSVGTGVTGFGLSFATGEDAAYAAYYTGAGSVDEATWSKGAWTTTRVADVDDPDESATGDLAANTAVAAGTDATVYVAWETGDGIQLASGTDSFETVDIGHTLDNGADPALATSKEGVVLSWYDTVTQNQMIAYYGDLTDVVVARPSPSLTVAGSTSGGAECGKDKTVALDISAAATTFDTNCLVGPADEKFTIVFDNQDTINLHNIDVFDVQGGKSLGATDTATGPATEKLPLSLAAGTYYFQCDVHPALMNGTLAVVKGAK
jgi:plastocyanin